VIAILGESQVCSCMQVKILDKNNVSVNYNQVIVFFHDMNSQKNLLNLRLVICMSLGLQSYNLRKNLLIYKGY